MLLTLGRPFICATLLPFFLSLTARSRGGSGLRAFAGQPDGARTWKARTRVSISLAIGEPVSPRHRTCA